MRVTVNGQRRNVPDGTTVAGLIAEMGLQVSATVAERNGEILDRSRFGEVVLADNDTVELVRFVGGG